MSTQKPKPKDAPELTENDAECLIYEAFRKVGAFVPQTPEEVEAAEADLGDEEVKLSPSLQDPLAILGRRPRPRAIPKPPVSADADAVENMACAAKNGSEIPPDVLAQMDADETEADTEGESVDGKD
jgi:hypothetical protein